MHSYGSCFANALRTMRIVQQRLVPYKTTRKDVMLWMLEEFQCSSATAYRFAAAAIDVLELSLAEDAPDVIARDQRARKVSEYAADSHIGKGNTAIGFKTVEV
jgi:hypothetical protein